MKYFLLACLAGALLLSCSSSRNSAEQLNNLNGNWTLTVFPNQGKTFAELFSMKVPDLQLDAPNRKVSGSTGCNRASGEFTVDGEEFKFGNLATTKMGCPGYDETTYLTALGRVNRFRLNADQLSFYQDSTLLMTFVRSK
jgi:heat shock protein HslJ